MEDSQTNFMTQISGPTEEFIDQLLLQSVSILKTNFIPKLEAIAQILDDPIPADMVATTKEDTKPTKAAKFTVRDLVPSAPLDQLKGIGRTYLPKLASAGYHTIEQLATCTDHVALAQKIRRQQGSLTVDKLGQMIEEAREVVRNHNLGKRDNAFPADQQTPIQPRSQPEPHPQPMEFAQTTSTPGLAGHHPSLQFSTPFQDEFDAFLSLDPVSPHTTNHTVRHKRKYAEMEAAPIAPSDTPAIAEPAGGMDLEPTSPFDVDALFNTASIEN